MRVSVTSLCICNGNQYVLNCDKQQDCKITSDRAEWATVALSEQS